MQNGSPLQPKSVSLEPVGVLGAGLLGSALVTRLRAAGLTVHAFDPDEAALQSASVLGAHAQASVEALCESCPCVVVAVYSAAQLTSALRAWGQVAHRKTRALICTTTLSPQQAVAMAALCECLGVDFVELPISGTSQQVLDGQALGLVAASSRVSVSRFRHVLDAITPNRVEFSAPGAAAKAKLAINLVLEINRSALAEGLLFAERMQLDQASFVEALSRSAAYSRVMDGKTKKMLSEEFSAEGRAAQSLKDVNLMADMAEALGLRLGLLQVQRELLAGCVDVGEGHLDSSIVIRELRRRASKATPPALAEAG